MIEAVMLWNEPNNRSHWDFDLDPEWSRFAEMVNLASEAIVAERPQLTKVLGGISPIDPLFVERMGRFGVLDQVDAVALHGFPLDWNHWSIYEWTDRLQEIAAVTSLPIWITEVGASTFGAEEIQDFGLKTTAELLLGKAQRIHWYSLLDLPRAWPATTRHREAEGSSYYRHFYMGLVREDNSPKLALKQFSRYAPEMGICQWFHFEDPRLETSVKWLRELGVKKLRTGLSWADSLRPDADKWFDKQIRVLDGFDLTVTFCFTPEREGIQPHHTSPPREPKQYADFCSRMVRRYAV
ncbi:MAG TPA: hypothetical protein VKV15_23430 [Bryobacteraceae bacterium]|nr:hypothetical protein [Bryobacteraceae bacterium]